MSIFGVSRHGGLVEAAAKDTLVLWLNTYLAEQERQEDRTAGSVQRPRSWRNTPELDKDPEDQLPCIILGSPGLTGPPTKEGDGTLRGTYLLAVMVVLQATTPDAAFANAKLYTAALRNSLLQHPSLGGFAEGTDLQDESYNDLPTDKIGSLGFGRVVVHVDVDDIVNVTEGPAEPSEDPLEDPGDWPIATEVPVVEVDRTDEP